MLRSILRRLGACLRPLIGRPRGDAGMTTAEYAIGTLTAVAFSAVLFKVVTSPSVQKALTDVIEKALK